MLAFGFETELPDLLDSLYPKLLVFSIVLQIGLLATLVDFVQRRLRDVEIATFDRFAHLPEKEGQDQGANMAAVDVRIAHDDQLLVTQFRDVEVFSSDTGAQSRDQRPDLLGRQHLVEARFFDVQYLAFERQHGLELPVAALLGGAAGGLALDKKQLRELRVALGTVRQLSRQVRCVQRTLAAGEIARLTRRLPRSRGFDTFAEDLARDPWVLFQISPEPFVDHLLDPALYLRGDQLVLGLAGELRIQDLERDHRGEPLPDVVTGQVLFQVLELAAGVGIGVDRAGERRLESRQMGSAIAVLDRIGETENVFLIPVVPLQGHFDPFFALAQIPRVLERDRLFVERGLVAILVFYKALNAARVAEGRLLVVTLIDEVDMNPAVQEREFTKPLSQGLVMEIPDGKNLTVR